MRWLVPAILAAAAAALAVAVDHAGEDVYYVPTYGVAIAAAAFAAAVAGGVVIWRSRAAGLGVAAAAATALFVLGVLAIFSIGLLLLLVAAVVTVAVARRAGERPAAVAGGVLLGAPLPVLAVIALAGPLVDCQTGTSGENVFLGFESSESSGSTTVSPDGSSTGRVAGEGYAYEYACRDGRLVRFELRD